MINLELTIQEATVLNQLLDLAVKSNGLQVAEAAVVLSHKIRTAVASAQQHGGQGPMAVPTEDIAASQTSN